MRLLSVLVSFILLSTCATTEQTDFDLVIANVTLIDGTGTPAQPNATVFVKDGIIAQITTGQTSAEGPQVVDGRGKYLIPGLIDAHAHPFPIEENLPRFVHFGVTSIFVPGCSDCSNENLATMRALSTGDSIPAPKVFHTSQHFTMEGRHPVKTYPSDKWVEGKTVYYVRDTLHIAAMVREVAQQPILGIKVTIEDGPAPPFAERIPTEFVAKIVEEAHKHDLKVFAHVDDIEEVRIAQEAGVDHIIHFVGVDIDWERDQEVIDRLVERDISWVTTLMIDKSFFYPAHPEWLDSIAEMQVFNTQEIERLRASGSVEESEAFLREAYGLSEPTLDTVLQPQLEDLRRLHEQGCNLVIGTDTGNDFIFPGWSMHEEMALMASGGFTPLEIITMATHNAADMLGILEETGTLEVGKAADMVLLEDNPLEDIRNSRSISAVFKGGGLQPRIGAR